MQPAHCYYHTQASTPIALRQKPTTCSVTPVFHMTYRPTYGHLHFTDVRTVQDYRAKHNLPYEDYLRKLLFSWSLWRGGPTL